MGRSPQVTAPGLDQEVWLVDYYDEEGHDLSEMDKNGFKEDRSHPKFHNKGLENEFTRAIGDKEMAEHYIKRKMLVSILRYVKLV